MAQRIAGAEELLGQGLIDDNHTGLASGIPRRENSSSLDGYAHRGKVSRRHPPAFRLWLIASNDGRLSLNLEAAHVFASAQREIRNGSDGAHSRQRFKACSQLLEESSRPAVDVEGQHRVGTETGLHRLHSQEA